MLHHNLPEAAADYVCKVLATRTGVSVTDRLCRFVSDRLSQFVADIARSRARFVMETITALLEEKALEVKRDGDCVVSTDLGGVNVANWAHTAMVGSTISKIETLDAQQQVLIKLAACMQGPLSCADLAAFGRGADGLIQDPETNEYRRPKGSSWMDRLHGQMRRLAACQVLCRRGLLKRWDARKAEQSGSGIMGGAISEADERNMSRFVLSNVLFRKVAQAIIRSTTVA